MSVSKSLLLSAAVIVAPALISAQQVFKSTEQVFVPLRGEACAGFNDLFEGTVAGKSQCEYYCATAPRCLSYEWWPTGHPTRGSNYCTLSSTCDGAKSHRSTTGADLWLRFSPRGDEVRVPPAPSSLAWEQWEERACPGFNEIFQGNVRNQDECEKICAEDFLCLSYEWWPTGHPTRGMNYCTASSTCDKSKSQPSRSGADLWFKWEDSKSPLWSSPTPSPSSSPTPSPSSSPTPSPSSSPTPSPSSSPTPSPSSPPTPSPSSPPTPSPPVSDYQLLQRGVYGASSEYKELGIMNKGECSFACDYSGYPLFNYADFWDQFNYSIYSDFWNQSESTVEMKLKKKKELEMNLRNAIYAGACKDPWHCDCTCYKFTDGVGVFGDASDLFNLYAVVRS